MGTGCKSPLGTDQVNTNSKTSQDSTNVTQTLKDQISDVLHEWHTKLVDTDGIDIIPVFSALTTTLLHPTSVH